MFSVKQAATKIGVSPSKVYELVRHRKVAHHRVDGKIILAEADLDAYLARCRIDAVGQVTSAPPQGVFKQLDPARLAKAWKARGVLPSP
jgi:excisionase family DNA binding protein